MNGQIKNGGPVDVLAENVEVRLWDSQWVNVVNHADCYRDMDKEEAIATAVRMTERLMAENITKGFPPSACNRAAVAELIEADIMLDRTQEAYDRAAAGCIRNDLWDDVLAARKRRATALARCGGAK